MRLPGQQQLASELATAYIVSVAHMSPNAVKGQEFHDVDAGLTVDVARFGSLPLSLIWIAGLQLISQAGLMDNVVVREAAADSAASAGIVTAVPAPVAVSEHLEPVLIAVAVAASAAVAAPIAAVFAARLAAVSVAQVVGGAGAQVVVVAVAVRVVVVVAAAVQVAVAVAAQAVPQVVVFQLVAAVVAAAASVVAVAAAVAEAEAAAAAAVGVVLAVVVGVVAAEMSLAVDQRDEYLSGHPGRIQCADLAGLFVVPAGALGSPPVLTFGMAVVILPRWGLVLLGPVSQVWAGLDYIAVGSHEWAQRARYRGRDPQLPSRPSSEPADGAGPIAVLSHNVASGLLLVEVEVPTAPHVSSYHLLLGPYPLNQSCLVLPAGNSNFWPVV